MDAIILMAIIFCIVWLGLPYLKKIFEKRRYEETEYYRQTQKTYSDTCVDLGVRGEYLIWEYLQKLDGYKRYVFNCYIPKEDGGTTEIDVILLHESGIYVFESKNYSGWIFGDETRKYWTQTLSRRRGHVHKEKFFNPIIQNKVHLKWLSKYIDKDISLFYSYIVFSDRCTLKDVRITSGQHRVINRYEILPAVRSNAWVKGRKLTESEIDSLYSMLQPLTQVDEAQKLAHVEAIQKKKEVSHSSPKPNNSQEICPWCGKRLVLKIASKGTREGKPFWGCSNYPRCRYIRNISSKK